MNTYRVTSRESHALWLTQAVQWAMGSPATRGDAPPPPSTWDGLPHFIAEQRVVGVISPAVVDLHVPNDTADTIRGLFRNTVTGALPVAHDAARASTALSTQGIDHLIVKGVPLALIAGKDVTARGPGDVDVWVRSNDLIRAEAALADAGWTRRVDARHLPLPTDGWRWRWFVHEMHEFPLARAGGSDIDLHWRLSELADELSFDFDMALASAEHVTIAGVAVPTLSAVHALEHCAQHARKEGWPSLRNGLDIIWLTDVLDDEVIRALADQSRNVRVALAVASHLAPDRARFVHLTSAEERLATQAWARCRLARPWSHERRRSSGRAAIRGWFDHAFWLWRSAPSWRVRRSHVTHVALRVRVLSDPRRRPWARHLRS